MVGGCMKLFKFEFSHVRNEERVYETILFETNNYNLEENVCFGFELGEYTSDLRYVLQYQMEFIQQIFECVTNNVVYQMMNLPGARFAITEARIITIV